MKLPALPTLAVLLLLGLGLLAGAWMAWQATEEDLARSHLARAEVIAVRQVEDGGFAVRLRFATADGRVVEASPRLEPRWPPRLGEVWEVRYDPAAPQRVWADAFCSTWGLPLALAGHGLFFTVLGGAGLAIALGQRPRPAPGDAA